MDYLEREFDNGTVSLLHLLNTLNSSHPNLLFDVKNHVQALYGTFVQAVNKGSDAVHQRMRQEAMVVHLQEEVNQLSLRVVGEERLAVCVAAVEKVANTCLAAGAQSPDISALSAHVQELRNIMEANAQHQVDLAALKTECATLSAKMLGVDNIVQQYEQRMHALKQELTGRIQQLQLMSKGMATNSNPVYLRLLAEMEQNSLKALAQVDARRVPKKASSGIATPDAHVLSSSSRSTPWPPSTPVASSRTASSASMESQGTFEVTLTRAGPAGVLGLMIQGGDNSPIVVKKLYAGEPAQACGLLRVGDAILAINGKDLRTMTHDEVVELLKTEGPKVTLVVTRPSNSVPHSPSGDAESSSMAEDLKRQGNQLMKETNWVGAKELYTRAITLASDVPTYFCNRAAASIKLGEYREAVEDCHAALRLAPSSSIAYNRLGVALEALGQLKDALDAHRQAAELEPDNATYASILKRATQLVRNGAANHVSSDLKKAAEMAASPPSSHMVSTASSPAATVSNNANSPITASSTTSELPSAVVAAATTTTTTTAGMNATPSMSVSANAHAVSASAHEVPNGLAPSCTSPSGNNTCAATTTTTTTTATVPPGRSHGASTEKISHAPGAGEEELVLLTSGQQAKQHRNHLPAAGAHNDKSFAAVDAPHSSLEEWARADEATSFPAPVAASVPLSLPATGTHDVDNRTAPVIMRMHTPPPSELFDHTERPITPESATGAADAASFLAATPVVAPLPTATSTPRYAPEPSSPSTPLQAASSISLHDTPARSPRRFPDQTYGSWAGVVLKATAVQMDPDDSIPVISVLKQ